MLSYRITHGIKSFERTFICSIVNLTDVTLADEDTNSMLTDNATMAFQGIVAMRVTQPGGQLWNQAKQVKF